MKNILAAVVFVSVLICPSITHAQMGGDPKKLIDELGRNANTYFLSANRPTYSISAFLLDKGEKELSLDPTIGDGNIALPVTFSYGISSRVQVFAGIDLHNASYKFDGSKINGVGDANLGAAFMFQKSAKFTHVIQGIVKIPTASKSKQLGTGYADFHIGLAEGFTAKSFTYELAVELGMLHRRDLPGTIRDIHIFPQSLIDSMNTYYNYTYEPEVSVTFTPSLNLSDKFLVYTGASFSRNTKLDYNTETLFAGFGYYPTYLFGLSAGVSKGLEKAGALLGSIGLTFTFR